MGVIHPHGPEDLYSILATEVNHDVQRICSLVYEFLSPVVGELLLLAGEQLANLGVMCEVAET